MFKVKAAQKGKTKNDVKHSAWIQSFLILFILKLNLMIFYLKLNLNDTELGKANKSVKMRTHILFKLSGSMFLKWKK